MDALLRCPDCGANISPQAKYCEECGTLLSKRSSTARFPGDNVFVRSNIDSSTQHIRIDKQINIQLPSSSDKLNLAESIDHARFLLQTKAFPDAIAFLRKVIQQVPDEPELYFYLALASLHGKWPRDLSFDEAEGIEQSLALGCNLGIPQAKLFYVWAWFKEDFYSFHGSSVPPPSIDELLAFAKQYPISHTDALELLGVAGISSSEVARYIIQRQR
jgi:hypothetical protein